MKFKQQRIQLDLPKSTSTVKAADKNAMEVTYQVQNGKANITLDDQSVANLEALGPALKASGNGKDKPVVNVRIEKAVPYQDTWQSGSLRSPRPPGNQGIRKICHGSLFRGLRSPRLL